MPQGDPVGSHVPTRAMEDGEDLYDEFGNYIGPAVPDEDDEDDDEDEDNDLEEAFASRYIFFVPHCLGWKAEIPTQYKDRGCSSRWPRCNGRG